MLPPLPARKSYDDVPRDSLAYALFLNPLMEVDPLDNNNDEPPTLKTLTARLKHLPGKHDQSAHGKPGRVGSAFRGAYSAARSGGASHVEARNQAKTAAEQVRQTMRDEKRAGGTTPTTPTPTAPTTPTASSGDLAIQKRLDDYQENGPGRPGARGVTVEFFNQAREIFKKEESELTGTRKTQTEDINKRLIELELRGMEGTISATEYTEERKLLRDVKRKIKYADDDERLIEGYETQLRVGTDVYGVKLSPVEREQMQKKLDDTKQRLAKLEQTTKADDSVGGVPRKYGARAGEVIAGNLGRDTGGKFTRVGGEGSIVRAAINRGIAAAGGGKRGAKRAAVSAAQKKRQQADTGAGVMDKLGFDASDWDYLASDKPQDATDPQFTRLIEQGLMENIDGMAYPSALGRKVAAAAGAGNEDKAKELLARDTAKRGARQAKMDAQISAYDEVINDETASPRARAIAARKRTALIGQSGTSTKASDGYAPPDGVRAQAKRGLVLRSGFGRGGTSVGIARARDLSNGKRMSRDTIMRMVSFFARHAVDKRPDWGNPSKPSSGYIAHLLWGGDAGKSWANKIANQIKADE